MAITERPGNPKVPAVATSRPRTRRKALSHHRFALLTIAPSVILIAVFVYGFIGYTARVSLSKWHGFTPNLALQHPVGSTYGHLMQTARFQADLRNVFIFTTLFLVLAITIGLLLAMLVHNLVRGRGFFRSLFLFPYSLSFIVTGVVWRWLFTPSTGANLILKSLGVKAGPKWITDPAVAGDVSGALNKILPGGDFIQVKLGIPLAIIPVVFAASWQLAGFAMANFLAALGAMPEEVREAAQLDGAGWWRYHFHVVLPMLRPTIATVAVILGYVSLKSFDLVYAMVGQGPGFSTDVPGIFVFDQMFRALRYNTGAAASVVMLLLVSSLTLPYLYRSYLKGSR